VEVGEDDGGINLAAVIAGPIVGVVAVAGASVIFYKWWASRRNVDFKPPRSANMDDVDSYRDFEGA
jgi:hypothetical protein